MGTPGGGTPEAARTKGRKEQTLFDSHAVMQLSEDEVEMLRALVLFLALYVSAPEYEYPHRSADH